MAMSDIDRIPWAKPHLFGEEEQEMMRALRSEWISGGPFLQELESMVADIVGVKHALATANGTAAIHLVYLGLGLSAGVEVVVPGFAYQAASNVALLAGLRPVFADVTPDTWCLDPDDVRRVLTPKTKAVMAVHSYGNVCAMDALRQVCEESGIVLLEDAAESFGSAWRGKLSGGIAHASTLSFHATKTITTGEGGMVLTDDDELADKVALYRSHGMRRQKVYYWHELPGHNFRLTNFQAAMGCAQIRHYDEVCSRRRALQANYVEALATLEGATLQRFEPAVHAVVMPCRRKEQRGSPPTWRH